MSEGLFLLWDQYKTIAPASRSAFLPLGVVFGAHTASSSFSHIHKRPTPIDANQMKGGRGLTVFHLEL